MFGLMRSRTCAMTDEERLRRRLHYCGTCKTIGRLYGNTSRIALNFDAVFLGELLSALTATDGAESEWARAYRSYNCLALPEESELPFALEYAATITLLAAEIKLDDRMRDERLLPWAFVRRFTSTRFRRVAVRLRAWDFPLDRVWEWVHEQNRREAKLDAGDLDLSPADALRYAAEPTAKCSGLAFAHGAVAAGRPAASEAMRATGDAIGRIVYLLDALRDFDQDVRRGQFNAIRAAYRIEEPSLPPACRREVVQYLREVRDEALVALAMLDLPADRLEQFSERLATNLARATGARLPVLARAQTACARGVTFADRRRHAARLAREVTRGTFDRQPFALRWATAPVVFAMAAAAGFLFPSETATAATPRECADASMNLMALGSAFGVVAMAPLRFAGFARRPRKPKQDPAGGDYGEAAADGCDCCCDCGDCCTGWHCDGAGCHDGCCCCSCCGDGCCCDCNCSCD